MKNWKRALAVFLTVILMMPAAIGEEAVSDETEIAVSESIEEAVPEQEVLLIGDTLESPEVPEGEEPEDELILSDAQESDAPVADEAPQMEAEQDANPAPQVRNVTVSGTHTESANVHDTLHLYVNLPGIQVTKWTTSKKKVATVSYKAGIDEYATVNVVSAGTAKLTAKLNDKKIKKLVVTLKATDPYQPSKLVFTPSTLTMKAGSTLVLDDYLAVTPDYIEPSMLVWSSSKNKVASVSKVDGQVQVKALSAGTAKITAASSNKKVKAVLNITVAANKLIKMNGKPSRSEITALNGSWTLWPISIEPSGNQLVCKFYLLNGTGEKVKRIENLNLCIATGTPDHMIAGKTFDKVTASCGKNSTKSLTLKLPLLESLDGIYLPEHYADGTLFFVLNDASVSLASTDDVYPFVRNPRLPMGPSIPVTDIRLSQGAAVLTVGQTLRLTATVLPDNAGIQSVLWSSSDPSVAAVNGGVITALSKGIAVITASAADGSGVKARCPVSVYETINPATGITLSQTTADLNVGGRLTLNAEVTPEDASDRNVTWSSSNPAIATVTGGDVIGISAGTVTITAATHNGLTAQCVVTVSNVPVTGIRLSKTTATLRAGETLELTATVEPDNATDQTLTWQSSNPSVASVSDGKVTGVAEGTATITVNANGGSGISAQCEVTVQPPQVLVTGVRLSPSSGSVMMGKTLQLTASVSPDDASNKNLLWSSDDTSVATVVDGLVTGVGKGTATITAAAADGSGKSDTCQITVNIIPVTGIRLSASEASMKVSEQLTLKATVSPATASYQNVVWSTSNESVASVDEEGVVTATGDGTADITATAADGSGVSAKCTVTVRRIDLTGITLNQNSAALGVNGELQLYAIITPEDASDKAVNWSSSDIRVATVTSGGLVKGVAEGSATITATTHEGGLIASCDITVAAPAVPISSLSLNTAEADVSVGSTLTLTPVILPANATNQNVSWTSDQPEVASVLNGVVTGVTPGSAHITATAMDGSGATAQCLVTVQGILIPLTGLSLNMTSTTLGIGETLILDVTSQPEDAPFKSVEWSSSNDNIVTVANTGLITAVSEGTARVTVRATGDADSSASASCDVTVTSVPINTITLTDPAQPLVIGSTLQLTPGILPANATNQKLAWSSSDAGVATVSDGLITAVAGGSTTITATAQDGSNAKASCTVRVISNTLTASVTDMTLKVGEKGVITMTFNSTSGNLTGYTSNKSIVSASWGKWSNKKINLTVSALAEGTATVTIGNSVNSDTCRVHVTVLPSESHEEPDDPTSDGSVKYRALLIGEEAFSPKCTRNRGDVTLMTKMLNSITGPDGGKYTIAQKFDLDKSGVKAAIASTFSGADEDDVSLFFIATHGDTKNSGEHAGALALISSSSGSESYIQMNELAKALQAVPGKVIVFIESCGSGAAVYTSDAEQNSIAATEQLFEESAQAFNSSVVGAFAKEDVSNLFSSIGDVVANTGEFRVENKFYVLTASRYQEESYGTENGPYNYFTRWLTNGIGTSGKMPADTNGDGNGITTLNELFKYISNVGDNHGFKLSEKTSLYYQHVQVYPANSSYQLFKR